MLSVERITELEQLVGEVKAAAIKDLVTLGNNNKSLPKSFKVHWQLQVAV